MNYGRIALATVGGMVAYFVAGGARFGALIGVFVVCAFVVHNYVNLNFALTLMLMQAVAYFVEWTVVGTVIGLLYKSSV